MTGSGGNMAEAKLAEAAWRMHSQAGQLWQQWGGSTCTAMLLPSIQAMPSLSLPLPSLWYLPTISAPHVMCSVVKVVLDSVAAGECQCQAHSYAAR